MPKNKRVLIPIIVIVVVSAVGLIWYFGQGSSSLAGGSVQASGTVEAVEVAIASEMSGRVLEVLAEKGAAVQAGEPLLRLDDTLLQSQRQLAVTGRESAKANLVTSQSGLEVAQAALQAAETGLQIAQSNSEAELLVAQQSLDNLNENATVARTEAQRVVAAANQAVRDATYQLDNYTVPSNQANMTATEAIVEMKKLLDVARAAFEPYRNEDSGNNTREDLKDALDEAQSDYDSAVHRLQYEANLEQAQARLAKAQQDLAKVQNGPNPDDVAALEARIAAIKVAPDQARAAVDQAKVGITQAQAKLEQAQTAVDQAQAQLDLVDTQIKKMVIYAPTSGIVLSRGVEPGEVIQAGAAVLTLAQLDRPTITVYVPEDRYGQIKLGDQATVTLDSFPGRTFLAKVRYIANQAEFTPRNVQTSEGRRTTVFAIELAIDNPKGELKPGMPADVCFGCR
jgi:multidrug resistance efflux pump